MGLDSGDEINALSFSPNRYWLCAAAGAVIKIWDLEQKVIVEELKPEVMGHKEGSPPVCTSLCWSSDGQTLFAGYTDNLVPVCAPCPCLNSLRHYLFLCLKMTNSNGTLST